jgi:hypothetical protein
MRKTLLSLIAVLGFIVSASAQINLRLENNTQQYLLGSLLDNAWMGATPPLYMDIPNNQSSIRVNPPVWTGFALSSVANWRGIQLRAYPSGIYYAPVYFTAVPYAVAPTPFGPSLAINVYCDILTPTDIYIRINP